MISKLRFDKICLVLICILLTCACNHVREEVIETYENGKPMLVRLYKGSKKDPTLVGEKMYYENGTLQLEKHFSGKPETPDGTWKYYWDNGNLFATGDFTSNHEFGSNWVFLNRNGENWYPGKLDSTYITSFSNLGTPSTVVFCTGKHQDVVQFYSNYTVRSTERLTDGNRQGKIYFYFPNGNVQVEANFENGVENGPYTVYHENGLPFYMGNYKDGKRIGIWEFYDKDGTLLKTQDYDKE
ncbi:MAG: hypothetical protein MJZ67_05565 [Bacteroidales bacterium]|nr:hypothetical protein [Bacteroidales bacterium]